MRGVLYTIDKLGESLAAAEQEIARLRLESDTLRRELDEKEETTKGSDITP